MKRYLYRIGTLLLIIGILGIIIWFAFSHDFGKEFCDDIVVVSPDGEHQLLIREWGTIGGTGAEIYAIHPRLPKFLWHFISTKAGSTYAADCCYPFSEGNYDIVWEDDCAVISYFSGKKTQVLSERSTWSVVRCSLIN